MIYIFLGKGVSGVSCLTWKISLLSRAIFRSSLVASFYMILPCTYQELCPCKEGLDQLRRRENTFNAQPVY